jgi:hypothetical protein
MTTENTTWRRVPRTIHTRAWRLLVWVLLASAPAVAQAQEPYVDARACAPLATLERSRQQLEWLREQREAGIARLPTPQHLRLALESLYRWSWHWLARWEAQRQAIEGQCARASQLRSEPGFTREAPVTWSYAPYRRYPDPSWDPFSAPPPAPRVYPGQRIWMYPPYARR